MGRGGWCCIARWGGGGEGGAGAGGHRRHSLPGGCSYLVVLSIIQVINHEGIHTRLCKIKIKIKMTIAITIPYTIILTYHKSELQLRINNVHYPLPVPAGVYLFPNPRQRFALRIWPGTIQVSRSR